MLIVPIVAFQPTQAEYKIVEIRRESKFAGKLGHRVSENLVVEAAGTRILVHIAGSYHTMCVRPGQRLHEGDTITIRGEAPSEGATIPRGRISKA
ncbi:hypothetical protein EON82_05820 [bacterium]|nr:MAG: hypothetical protein EON82_05820 [bacterium]